MLFNFLAHRVLWIHTGLNWGGRVDEIPSTLQWISLMNAGIAADLLEDLTAVVSISSIHHVVRCLGTAEMRGPICQDLWARDIMLSKHYQCSSTNLSPTS